MTDETDQFGLRKGSLRSRAAALYLDGATSKDVETLLGRAELNVLSLLREKGFKVEKRRVRIGKARPCFLYTVISSQPD